MPRAEKIALALLAAGRSTRFGEADKLTATLGDRRLIDWAASAGLSLPARWHLLVTGPEASYDPAVLGYHQLSNPAPTAGLASSLRIAATEAERLGAGALIVLLADMPFVEPAHLERLVATFREDGARAVFSRAAMGPPQPPALFPAALFPAIQSLNGDRGARDLAVNATIIEASEAELIDIDTIADLDRARRVTA